MKWSCHMPLGSVIGCIFNIDYPTSVTGKSHQSFFYGWDISQQYQQGQCHCKYAFGRIQQSIKQDDGNISLVKASNRATTHGPAGIVMSPKLHSWMNIFVREVRSKVCCQLPVSLIRVFFMVEISVNNTNRASVIANMPLEEFNRA